MTDLIPLPLAPRSAFGSQTARQAQYGALRMHENLGLALASLALRKDQDAPTPFGLRLPGPGGWTAGEDIAAFWTGPGQWMIAAPGHAETDFALRVAAEVPNASVSEQTDGWVAIDIEGPGIDGLLERLVNLPAAATAPGCATRTGLHHMSVFLIRPSETRLSLLALRSAAESMWHAVAQAATQLETLT